MAQDASKAKLSFGFKPVVKPSQTKPLAISKPAAFGALANEDDDEQLDDDDGRFSRSSTASGSKAKPKSASSSMLGLAPGKSATPESRAERKKQQEAQKIDRSVFDYDSVYDSMKEAEKKVKAAKQEESAARKPKYISNFLESADLRKRDRLRAEAKMIQKERAAEGDEFADKEAFVTSAYKEQQMELTQQEEEEKRKEEQDWAKNKGMGTFYRDMLNETSAAREAAIAASIKKDQEVQSKEAAMDQPEEERSDASLAKQAQERGLEVELNDDHQIVDKRDLLSKGLNVITKKRQQGSATQQTKDEVQESREERDRRRKEYETRMNRKDQRSRQSALIEEQMLEIERKRKREEEEEQEKEKEKVNQKRNDDSAISSAKQRFLERKRKKMQEAQQ